MSELITTRARANVRLHLLSSVSALSLLTIVAASQAKAEDSDRPTVWIELGGQLERMGDAEETFAPSFLQSFDHLNFNPVLPLQRPPRYSNGAEGKISFMPRESDWVFSVAARYGRANGQKLVSQQKPKVAPIKGKGLSGAAYYIAQREPYHINTNAQHVDRHSILDFQVGKDVGLGLFTGKDASILSLGVRFAQFTSARAAEMDGVPDLHVVGTNVKYGVFQSHHRYAGSIEAKSNFHGIGPSISWDASAPIMGRDEDGQISVDWGLSGAVLFGRQKVQGETSVTSSHYSRYVRLVPANVRNNNFIYHQPPANFERTRSVTVPNLGGFAGVSFRYSALKVSFGYRADVYFGAMDGGIEARKTEDRSFYGPFANFSIGLGG